MNAWVLAGLTTNALMVAMALVWVAARRVNNAGWVDVAWSYAFVLVGVLVVWLGSAPPARSLLLLVMIGIWSLRLGTHLALRVGRHHPQEDSRYAALRGQFPKRPWLMFFGFFQVQAVLVVILSTPFFIAASNPAPELSAWELVGAALWLLALLGESLADAQLAAFRKDPANAGCVCDHGLWRISRHPNYFCEWLVWVAFAVFALGSPGGCAGLLSPALMLYLLTQVTGIPPAEAASLQSRGAAYRAYQQRTSPFFPWLPKSKTEPMSSTSAATALQTTPDPKKSNAKPNPHE